MPKKKNLKNILQMAVEDINQDVPLSGDIEELAQRQKINRISQSLRRKFIRGVRTLDL